jgi:hypothetical protein
MRTFIPRLVAAFLTLLALAPATAAASGLGGVDFTRLGVCQPGHLGLAVRLSDAPTVYLCATSAEQTDAAAPDIVGLLVRSSDGSVRTIDLAAAPRPEAQTADDRSLDAGSAQVRSSEVSSADVSSSVSSSTSTTCVNGRCTTQHSQSACIDGACSSEP